MSKITPTYEQELKHKFQETQLPHIDMQARVLEAYSERRTKHKMKPPLGRRLLVAGYSIMAVILLLGIVISFPASAEQLKKIPVVGKFFAGNSFSYAGDSGIVHSKTAGLSTLFNEVVNDNGVTITLQDVMYDGARLSIGYQIDSEPFENIQFFEDISFKINGNPIPNMGLETKPHQIHEYQSVGIMTLDIDRLVVENSFDLEINIGAVTDFSDEVRVEGKWSFTLPIANKALEKSKYKVLTDEHMAKSKRRQFKLTSYLLTPATTSLNFEYIGNIKQLSFQLKDERGMYIDFLDSQMRKEKDGIWRGTIRFAPIASDTKEIFVTPYIWQNKESKKVTSALTDEFPIVLSQGKGGEIIVKDVVFSNDKTLIYYEVKGKVPLTQYRSLWLQTADGQMIISDNGKRTQISDTSYDFVLEYPPLDPLQPYVLGTMTQTDIKLIDELTIKLEIDN